MSQQRLAIVGFAFRFPGPQGDAFWTALTEGRNLITTVDPTRWSQELYLHPRESEPGSTYSFAAGSLGDVSGFDAAFFGISPREAAQMDPQQRLLLELSWEALESAGIVPSAIRRSRTGVFVGFSGSDYSYRRADDMASVDAFLMTGNTASIAANRISYILDLRGPSMAVDTACSSSLVALHQACLSLATGESDLALAGAVNLHLHPLPFIGFAKASMLSKTGSSRAFDAAGDGYVRSEGGAIVVLKPLERALADGNRIHAVIAATGVNCDGKTSSLTVPSAEAQADLLREVYARAGIEPAEIDYLEAHGTGTAVGDPIEAAALGEALGRRRPAGSPLRIGSVKTNLGHLETAAGMAGLVKALYCLRERRLPPSLHFETPNAHIAFEDWNLEVVTDTTPLDPGKRLVIGINSFGFGGANAHAVLESFPEPKPPGADTSERAVPLALSARSEGALRDAAARMAQWLRSRTGLPYYDIAYSAACHREWLDWRAIAFGSNREQIAASLEAFAAGRDAPGVASGRGLRRPAGPVFVYSGNGSQWAGMGRALMAESARFRESVDAVAALFSRHARLRITEALEGEDLGRLLETTEIAQPLLFAVQVGITDLLRDWGLAPVAVLGHSVGEIAAAWASGALTLEQAVRVVYERSTWQGTTRGAGGMTAVALGEREAANLLAEVSPGARIALAAVNSPASVTVAGARADLETFEAALAARGASHRRLLLDYAFHSAAMEPIRDAVMRALRGLTPAAASVPFISAVTGEPVAGERLDADYWWRNIREPVRFAQAVAGLVREGQSLFIEIGPQPILRGYLGECFARDEIEARALATLARGADGEAHLRRRACEAFVAGSAAALRSLYAEPGRFVDLPRYPWQRERHWHAVSPEGLDLINQRPVHALLGHRSSHDAQTWENQLDLQRLPNLADHRLGDDAVFPAAGFAELALAAGADLHREGALREVEDLEIRTPLLLGERQSRTLRVTLDATGGLAIASRERASDEVWRAHAVARLPSGLPGALAIESFQKPARDADIPGAEHYRHTAAAGLEYGPAFRAVAQVWVDDRGVSAELATPAPIRSEIAQSWLHPVFLDAAFQLLVHLMREEMGAHPDTAFVPVRIGSLSLLQPHSEARYARFALLRRGPRSVLAHCTLYREDGAPLALARDVRFRAVVLKDAALAGLTRLEARLIPMPVAAGEDAASPPSAKQLQALCAKQLHAAARLAARGRYANTVEPLLEAMFCAFAADAVRGVADAEVAAEARPLRARLTQIAGEDAMPEGGALFRELLGDYPDHAQEILWLARIGAGLDRVLRGAVDAPMLLQPHADEWAAEDWTLATLPCAEVYARAIGQVAAACVQALPAGKRLRILSLDAGYAVSSARVAALLDPDRCDWVVRSPLEPALAGGEAFDLVLVEDGLAWAADHGSALEQLRAQMKRGGLLVVLERRPSRAVGLAIEALALESWNLPGAMPKTAEAWRMDLGAHGFRVESLLRDAADDGDGTFLVIAAAEPREDATTGQAEDSAAAASRCWIVLSDRRGYSRDLAEAVAAELRLRGCTVHAIHQPDEGVGIAWEDVLKSVRGESGSVDGVLLLAGLRTRLEQQAARCESLAGLLGACAALGIAPACRVVTARGHERPDEAPLWGFARAAINEYPNLDLKLVDLAEPAARRAMVQALAETLLAADAEDEVVLTAQGRYALRLDAAPLARGAGLETLPLPGDAVVRLCSPHAGQLKNLAWTGAPCCSPADDEVVVEVRAAGLNFRDVMSAVGQLPDEALEGGYAGASLGMEFSGVVRALGSRTAGFVVGDEVMGFAPGSFATRVLTRADAIWKKPADWSFEAASTIPIAFLTAHYALDHLARLAEGEKILIHGAAGGVGLAAVQLARLAGAEIYATAGSDAKRDVLRLLGAEYVLDSRSLDFEAQVLSRTGGRGVDVVLNSLAGEAMLRSLRIVGPHGRFLELGKRDFYENTRVGLRPLRNNVAYFGVDVDQLMLERPVLTRRLMEELLALFGEGSLRPLPYRAYAAGDAIEAFRQMQQSRHIGKVVVSLDPPPRAERGLPRSLHRLALPAEATYLVTGGLRGFGLQTALWLAARGARHLVLASRSGVADSEAQAMLEALAADGVRVRVAACDVADRQALGRLLTEVRASMPPLRGVVHAAAVIDDGLIRSLTRARLQAVLAPKARGAANLHALTRDCALEFFVLFSSATTYFGNPGQAAYVAANRYLEVLARARRAAGLPALCIAWGPIADAGYLARNPEVRARLEARVGGSALSSAQALQALEQALLAGAPDGGVIRLDRGLPRLLSGARARKYERLVALAGRADEPAADPAQVRRWLEELDDSGLAGALTDALKKEIAGVLRMPVEKLDAATPLQDLGLDSLMGVELMTAVEARFGVSIPALALSEIGSIERLVARIMKELRRGRDGGATAPESGLARHARLVAEQHAPEVAREQVDAFLEELKARGQ